MGKSLSTKSRGRTAQSKYVLDEQVGYILRQASQRHAIIFSKIFEGSITPTQWAAMSKLLEVGACSQNELGRMTSMDVATIKGVIDRLTKKGLTEIVSDPTDGRRFLISLSKKGKAIAQKAVIPAFKISKQTLAPLNTKEQELFLSLLKRLT